MSQVTEAKSQVKSQVIMVKFQVKDDKDHFKLYIQIDIMITSKTLKAI